MIRIGHRESQYRWSDLLMWGEDSQNWLVERVKLQSVAAVTAKPAIYTVKLASSGDSSANGTTIVGGQTFTAKSEPSTSAGTTEYALTATAAQIAAIVQAKGLTNYTVTVSGDTLTYTQTTAGTGSAITFGSGTDSTVTGTVTNTQQYAAAVTAVDYNLMAGEPVALVSTDSKGVKTVTPITAATGSENYSSFVGFIMDPMIAKNGDTVEVAMCSGRCRLNIDKMLKYDVNENAYDWSIGSTTLRGYAEAKGFKFGQNVSGLEFTN